MTSKGLLFCWFFFFTIALQHISSFSQNYFVPGKKGDRDYQILNNWATRMNDLRFSPVLEAGDLQSPKHCQAQWHLFGPAVAPELSAICKLPEHSLSKTWNKQPINSVITEILSFFCTGNCTSDGFVSVAVT